ncbi:MAG: hypothetical protein ACYSXF_12125 [Planctomycetota bacterium]
MPPQRLRVLVTPPLRSPFVAPPEMPANIPCWAWVAEVTKAAVMAANARTRMEFMPMLQVKG